MKKTVPFLLGWSAAWLATSTASALTPAEAEARVAQDDATVTFLEHLCDDHGGRLTGAPANEAAMRDLEAALREMGLEPVRETFPMRGWVRAEDELEMVAPVTRDMRAIGLGYIEPSGPIHASVVELGNGGAEAFADVPAGAVGLFGPHSSGRANVVAARAVEAGLSALLFINRIDGGQVLARTGGFHGEPLPLPVFSITQEEGLWIRRLLARDAHVSVGLQTQSYGKPIETSNLRVTIPGRTSEKVVVGAHFDSWDLGQGAIDNGLGIAQLMSLARVLRDADLKRTVELVWYNGEEQGLWGSRHAVDDGVDAEDPPVVMLNLDMVGVPVGVNAMGHDDLLPLLERWNRERGEDAMEKGVANKTWMASDHTPYQVAGVRIITFNAPIDHDSVRYYHDFADTFDKLTPEMIKNSSAVIASLVVDLANADDLPTEPVAAEKVQEILIAGKLESRLRAIKLWPF